jgi:Holliday junction resolvase RusA-like endonuclease
MSAIAFRVVGVPQPKGSMKAFQARGMKCPIVTESNRNVRSWSQLVAAAASHRMSADHEAQLMLGALAVRLVFALPRPKAIKARPVPHIRKPDLDKLTRAILDALTGIVYRDDAQVVDLRISKGYAEPGAVPVVDVMITEVSVQDTPIPFISEGAPC